VAPTAPLSDAIADALRSRRVMDLSRISRDVIEPGLKSAPVSSRRTLALEADVIASVTASAPKTMAIFFTSKPPTWYLCGCS
jgi:hypothetical protein